MRRPFFARTRNPCRAYGARQERGFERRYFQKHTGALRNGMRRYETAGVPTMSAA